jgi:hypothetical protein
MSILKIRRGNSPKQFHLSFTGGLYDKDIKLTNQAIKTDEFI